MKLLQINVTANVGSTGRIAEGLGQIAQTKGWESYIAYGRHFDNFSKSKTIRIGTKFDNYTHLIQTRLFDRHGFGSKRATRAFVQKLNKINPDAIILHNLHGYYLNIALLFSFLRKFQGPVFWILYDCWSFTGHCAYFDLINCEKWKDGCIDCPCKNSYPRSIICNSAENYKNKKAIFSNINNLKLIVHSEWLKNNVLQSFLSNYPVIHMRNGINLDDFGFRDPLRFREKYNLVGKFVILGVANVWEERKGLNDFMKLSSKLKKDEVIILDGLSKKQMKDLPYNIISIGKAKNTNELSIIYSSADVFFNPTYEDNFPTTNLEAMACGVPVVTYDTGGSPEAIDNSTGFVTNKGDIQNVYAVMSEIKTKGVEHYRHPTSHRARKLFNQKDRYMELIELIEESIKNKEK